MLQLPQETGNPEPFVFGEVLRTERGGGPSTGLEPFSKTSVQLSHPIITSITPALAAQNAELSGFLEVEQSQYRYDYVLFGCTFFPVDTAPFEKAWVEIKLKTSDSPVTPQAGNNTSAVAWSLTPREMSDVTKQTQTISLGAKLKFHELELADAKAEQTTERSYQNFSLRAYGELTAAPYWEFRKTEGNDICGDYRLALIVRSPIQAHTEGYITLSAAVAKRKFLMFKVFEAGQEPATVRFSL